MMKRLVLLTAFLLTAPPALAHESQDRRIYDLERVVERLLVRIERLERNQQLPDSSLDADSDVPPEYKALFDCQAKARNTAEMRDCAKHIPE